ncbi:DUF3810 domain-containing protein [Flavobacteriaceae bacterium]|nr:DUF3810 domain-containing protein [Flavobacteriaceae bacterium]
MTFPKNKKLYIAALLPIQIVIVKILARFPDLIEKYYSNGLYQFISKTSRYLLGWIPFSIGDLLYALLILYILKSIIKNRRLLYQKPLHKITSVLAFLSVIYFAFNILWGLNYYRNPISKTLNIETDYTTQELLKVTEILIENSNKIHSKVAKNDTTKAIITKNRNQLFNSTIDGYSELQKKYPFLKYTPKSIKKSVWSLPLTYMGYSGYLNPFTNEAQVNSKIPKYYFPFVSCHEQGHQIGYAAENETNFIGYLACMKNPDKAFNYAGITFAVRYCLNEVYRRDPKSYETLIKKLNVGIKKDFKESQDFWEDYQNPAEVVFKKTYDLFLKSNNQQKGIKSYSYVVALIVNYELNKLENNE